MNFISDNANGADPRILDALTKANSGAVLSYGGDPGTARLQARFGALFGRAVTSFPVVSGTAANALALATLTPPHGLIFCHARSHIMMAECGAVEFHSHGARLVGVEGENCKIDARALAAAIDAVPRNFAHSMQPATVTLSQSTELGTVYAPAEVRAIADICHARGLKLHMDGARFANALAYLDVAPAQASWECGVDVLSFGASKGGALAAEAVIFFDAPDASDFMYRRKKAGHLISKMRFVSAQLEAYVEDGLWLGNAAHANAMAAQLAQGLKNAPDVRLTAPVQTNMVFADIPTALAMRLREGGAIFHDWGSTGKDRVTIRLVTSFATPQTDVAKVIELAGG
jgi:threonine aldolase